MAVSLHCWLRKGIYPVNIAKQAFSYTLSNCRIFTYILKLRYTMLSNIIANALFANGLSRGPIIWILTGWLKYSSLSQSFFWEKIGGAKALCMKQECKKIVSLLAQILLTDESSNGFTHKKFNEETGEQN